MRADFLNQFLSRSVCVSRPQKSEISDFQFALLLAGPVILFLGIVMVYPLFYSVWLSFQKMRFFGGLKIKFVGFGNFLKVLQDGKFWDSLGTSLQFTAESVIFAMLLGLGFALVLSRPFPFRNIVRSIIILPWAVSLYGTGIMFAYMLRGQTSLLTSLVNHLGFETSINLLSSVGSLHVLSLANAWNMAPLVTFFLVANISTIPERLYHLAAIDRLDRFETFRHVTLPPLQFTLFVMTCITAVLSYKCYDLIACSTQGGPGRTTQTLTLELTKISFTNRHMGYGAAMSFFLLATILSTTFGLYYLWGKRIDK